MEEKRDQDTGKPPPQEKTSRKKKRNAVLKKFMAFKAKLKYCITACFSIPSCISEEGRPDAKGSYVKEGVMEDPQNLVAVEADSANAVIEAAEEVGIYSKGGTPPEFVADPRQIAKKKFGEDTAGDSQKDAAQQIVATQDDLGERSMAKIDAVQTVADPFGADEAVAEEAVLAVEDPFVADPKVAIVEAIGEAVEIVSEDKKPGNAINLAGAMQNSRDFRAPFGSIVDGLQKAVEESKRAIAVGDAADATDMVEEVAEEEEAQSGFEGDLSVHAEEGAVHGEEGRHRNFEAKNRALSIGAAVMMKNRIPLNKGGGATNSAEILEISYEDKAAVGVADCVHENPRMLRNDTGKNNSGILDAAVANPVQMEISQGQLLVLPLLHNTEGAKIKIVDEEKAAENPRESKSKVQAWSIAKALNCSVLYRMREFRDEKTATIWDGSMVENVNRNANVSNTATHGHDLVGDVKIKGGPKHHAGRHQIQNAHDDSYEGIFMIINPAPNLTLEEKEDEMNKRNLISHCSREGKQNNRIMSNLEIRREVKLQEIYSSCWREERSELWQLCYDFANDQEMIQLILEEQEGKNKNLFLEEAVSIIGRIQPAYVKQKAATSNLENNTQKKIRRCRRSQRWLTHQPGHDDFG